MNMPWFLFRPIGKILLGLLMYSTTVHAASVIRLGSLAQFDSALRGAGPGSASVILALDAANFSDPKEAQQLMDAVNLARTWDFWIFADGRVTMGLSRIMNVVMVNKEFPMVSDQSRAELMFNWLWDRLKAVPFIDAEVLKLMEAMIPSTMAPLRPAISFILQAKGEGNMERLYGHPRTRLHAFRQVNLKLQLIHNPQGCDESLQNKPDPNQNE